MQNYGKSLLLPCPTSLTNLNISVFLFGHQFEIDPCNTGPLDSAIIDACALGRIKMLLVALRGGEVSQSARGQRVCALALLIIITTMVTARRHAISVSVCGRDNCTQPQCTCELHASFCECHYANGHYRTTPIKMVKRVLFFRSFACVVAFCCSLQSPWRFGCDRMINCWRFIKMTRESCKTYCAPCDTSFLS
jgi:hypothetical protein